MSSKILKISLVILVVVLVEIIGAFIFYENYKPRLSNNLLIYRSIKYGFEIDYPTNLVPEKTFKTFYHLSDKWRAKTYVENSKGIPIVSIPVYRIDNNNYYPRYYSAEVRIGASKDPQDIKDCLKADPYSKATSTDEVINGITFKKFKVQNAGMMQYLNGFSYRTIHNDACYAVEQLAAGSNYRDQASPNDISDSILDSYFDKAGEIIRTFKFIR